MLILKSKQNKTTFGALYILICYNIEKYDGEGKMSSKDGRRVLIACFDGAADDSEKLKSVCGKAAENLDMDIDLCLDADSLLGRTEIFDVVYLIFGFQSDIENSDRAKSFYRLADKVYAYFRVPLRGDKKSVIRAREYFRVKGKGIADFYDCDDTLLYRIVASLASAIAEKPEELCVSGNKLCLCGEKLKEIDFRQIADFKENEGLCLLEKQFVGADMKRYLMQDAFNEGGCSKEVYAQYVRAAENVKYLRTSLDKRRNSLLRALMIKNTVFSETAKRGIYCDDTLCAASDCISDCRIAESEMLCALLRCDEKREVSARIAAGLIEIELIKSRGNIGDREISDIYGEIMPLVKKKREMPFALCDYVSWLSVSDCDKVADEVKTAKKIFKETGCLKELGDLCRIVGDMWYREAGFGFALGYYTESADAYCRYNKQNSDACLLKEAQSCAKSAKALTIEKGLTDGTISLYKKAVEYAERGSAKHLDELGDIYSAAAFAFRCVGNTDEALHYGKAAKDILTLYYRENPEDYASRLADACSEECAYYLCNDPNYAVKLSEEVVRLRREAYVYDPDGNAEELAVDYCNLAKVKLAAGNVSDAYSCAVKSAELICAVYANSPENSIVATARTYFEVGNICYTAEKYGEAREYMLKGVELYAILCDEAPALFSEDYAEVCQSYSEACKYGFREIEEAEKYCKIAIEIRESGLKQQPEKQLSRLVELYYDAIFYAENKDDSKGIKKYLLGCVDKERYVKDENAEKCVPAIIGAYVRLGNIAAKEADYRGAAEYYAGALRLADRTFCGKKYADEKSVARLYLLEGEAYYRCGEEDKAIGILTKGMLNAKRFFKDDEDIKVLFASACEMSGDIFYKKEETDSALLCYCDAVTASYGSGDEIAARLSGKVALCYGKKGDAEKEKAFLKLESYHAERLHEKYDGRYTGYLMSVYARIAGIYCEERDYEMAEKFFCKASTLKTKGERLKLLQAKICISASGASMSGGKCETALNYLGMAEKRCDALKSVQYDEEKKKIYSNLEKLFRMAGAENDAVRCGLKK